MFGHATRAPDVIETKTTVVLLFGGRSSEHSISCATAGGVLGAIDRTRFDVIPVGITREGAFTLQPDDAALFALDGDRLPIVDDNGTRVHWPSSADSRELSVADESGIRSLADIDVVFPILHGRFGEDGTVQGMLELLGLPYVGAGVLASAVAMDKDFTKAVLKHFGIAVAPWITVTDAGWLTDAHGIAASVASTFSWPVFVKPARAGSSVGVSRATDPTSLAAAIDLALAEDGKVLIEEAMVGREIECAVLAGHEGAPPRASVAGEVITGEGEFYDFTSKYVDADAAQLVCPADLTAPQLAEVQSLAVRAFSAIDGAGLARVDFFLTDSGFVVNEINTMPGFTPISMFPKCWMASGMTYPDLITELITLGRATRR